MSWARLLSSLALGAGLFILLELGLVSVLILTSLTYLLLAAILPSGNSEPVDPANKAVFITGCDRGFGNELAKRLLQKGYTVFAGCMATDCEGATALKALSRTRMHLVPLDITKDDQTELALKYVEENLGNKELWALVNNAGIGLFCEAEWCPVSAYEKMFEVNSLGMVRVTKAFLPLLRQAQGRVVNVASLAGRLVLPGFIPYAMSKFACIAFSDGLRREMVKFRVKVITVEPALYTTAMAAEKMHLDNIDKYWEATPPIVKKDYGESYYEAFRTTVASYLQGGNSNIAEVIDVMEEAVTSSEPKVRYVPNTKAFIKSTILRALPVTLVDYLIMKIGTACEPSFCAKKHE